VGRNHQNIGKWTSTVPTDLYTEEARKWNQLIHNNPRHGIAADLLPEGSDTDYEDLDDLDWCGNIERTATVLKSAASLRYKKPQKKFTHPHPVKKGSIHAATQMHNNKLQKAMQNSEHNWRTTCPQQFVSSEERTQKEDFSKGTQTDVLIEVRDQNTQTTPADFRIAMIRTPLTTDFIAIHNNESGHHGLDHSYRKLLKRCGSKWANERGEATRVKALLKEFIDACPICQKVRGMHEKVKAKHSFIVSRPFLEVSYDFHRLFTTADKNGNRYLLVAIDNFLKIVEIKPVAKP